MALEDISLMKVDPLGNLIDFADIRVWAGRQNLFFKSVPIIH
jgi:hypothetical protein